MNHGKNWSHSETQRGHGFDIEIIQGRAFQGEVAQTLLAWPRDVKMTDVEND